LQVDVLTFSSVTYPILVDLAMYGQVMAIPDRIAKSQSWLTAYGGTALLSVASGIKGANLQQFAFQEIQVAGIGGTEEFINGSFVAPFLNESTSLLAADMDIVFITPWIGTLVWPVWYMTDPDGTEYTNTKQDIITKMWTSQVKTIFYTTVKRKT
jgi:hypothetical protein